MKVEVEEKPKKLIIEEMKKSVPITPLNNLNTLPNVPPSLTLQIQTPLNATPMTATSVSKTPQVLPPSGVKDVTNHPVTTTTIKKPYIDFSIPWNKNGSNYEKPKSRENSPKNTVVETKKETHHLTLKDEIYSKIFAKNMLINQMKQNLTETIQSKTTKNADSFEKQKEFEMALHQFQQMQAQTHKSDLDWLEEKIPGNLNENIVADKNIEEFDNHDLLGQIEKMKPRLPTQTFMPESTSSLGLDESKQALLNSYDRKVLEDLAKMSDLINHNNKVLSLKEVVENPSMAFHNLRKKIHQDDVFKSNKFYVPEIPMKKPTIKDVHEQNEEENRKHREELEKFKADNEMLMEFENILDNSTSLVMPPKSTEPRVVTKRGLVNLENDFVIDENDFLNGITKCDSEERNLTSESYSIDLDLSTRQGQGQGVKKY